jgi:prolyl-tRNA synthetase
LKSLVYVAGDALVLAVVRGDHEINEIKLSRALGVSEVHLASAADVEKATGAAVGFAGPVGFKGRVLVDHDAAAVSDAVTGANETDHHLKHVSRGRDYQGEVADLRNVVEGDACPVCGGALKLYRGIEAGHIFLLGTRYSTAMGANYLAEDGNQRPLVMGCYGIGVSRLIATVIEQHHDENGISWPMNVAPYQVHVVQVGEDAEVVAAVAELERGLEAAGIEVLIDDREERPGVKFKDADLIGIPLRVTVGAKSLKAGNIELKPRTEPDPKKAELLPVGEAVATLVSRVRASMTVKTREA